MYSRRSIENGAMCFVALVLTGALMRFVASGADTADGDPRAQMFLLFCYLIVIAIALAHFRWTIAALRRNPAVVAISVLGFVSVFWAESPDIVLRRAIAIGGTTLFGVVIAIRLTFAEQLRLFRWTNRLIAALSLALMAVSPHSVIATVGEGWAIRGVFIHKNHAGAAMALGFLMEWYFKETSARAKLLRRISLFVFFVFLVAANSATSLVAVIATILVVSCFNFLHVRCKIPLQLIFALVLIGSGTALALQDVALQALGRNTDLTGRTELWAFVFSMIAKRPLLGYGLSGFWMGASEETLDAQKFLGWNPIYAHNGYLEIALSLGIVGLLLVLFIIGTGLKRVLANPQMNQSAGNMWPIAFFVFVLVHNMGECTLLMQNSLEWSLCIATVIGADPLLLNAFSAAEHRNAAALPEVQYA
jgi:exopolysaccharide production protein ExoQ